MINLKIKKAFTIAEVIIVLTLIGIVASLTMPNLLQSTDDIEYINSWKKSYSSLEQATNLALIDLKGTFKNKTESQIEQAYLNNLKIHQDCTSTSVNDQCGMLSLSQKYLTGGTNGNVYQGDIQLADGSSLNINYDNANCDTGTASGANGTDTGGCGYIMIDTNGIKSPNTWGLDIFIVHLTEFGLMPSGGDGDWYSQRDEWACGGDTGKGGACAAWYLMGKKRF